MTEVIDVNQKFSMFDDHWLPHVLGEVNDCSVKIAKLSGEFPWHSHEHEDEMFFVIKGSITIRLRESDMNLSAGQFVIIPRGVEHQPLAAEEAWVMLFEPKSTKNTGNITDAKLTCTDLPRI